MFRPQSESGFDLRGIRRSMARTTMLIIFGGVPGTEKTRAVQR
jgi:hypothetical protein